MEADAQTEPDQDWAPPFGILLSRLRSAPEPRRPNGMMDHPHDRTPRKRESPPPLSHQPSVVAFSSQALRHVWPDGGASPRTEFEERPDKRLRLDYIPNNTEAGDLLSKSRTDSRDDRGLYSLEPRSPTHTPESGNPYRSLLGSCSSCADTESLVLELVSGLLELQSQITQALAIATDRNNPSVSPGLEVSRLGLKQSLSWTIREIRSTTRLIQENAASKPGLPSLANVVRGSMPDDVRRASIHGQPSSASSYIDPFRRMPFHLGPARGDDSHGRATDSPPERLQRPFDQQLPPIQQGGPMRRNPAHDPGLSDTGQSPNLPSSSSVFALAQSPIPTQTSSLTLPSPPAAQFTQTDKSGSAQYSPTPTHTPHSAHLHDLQHQLSTKTLAVQTLQREHDQLLAAFSRSQLRCTALEKKSQVADHEINTLTEDKIRLQQRVEALEKQVEELVESRDQIRNQSTADMAQWRQIMTMSSQLQLKGAEEARQYKTDREAWEQERILLQNQIEALKSEKVVHSEQRLLSGRSIPGANDQALSSDSDGSLREELGKVRRRCAELGSILQDLNGEAEHIDSAVRTMERLRRALTGRQQRSEDG